ncbi:sensor histidine kinase [Vibrio gallicus]|uniref:sensor histidine kinase n=1 Tax=Vibrio gallicus TaxID=190897 RepID=UPI0021C499B0|nr:sensor histidine kinase [Vibrio gallicus]
MNSKLTHICIKTFLLVTTILACSIARADKPDVDIGVLTIRGNLHAEHRWQPTVDYLNNKIPEVNFVLHPLDQYQLTKAVKEKTMDFVLTNPGQAVRLGRQYALSWIATLTTRLPNKTNYGIGSALVVRANSPYKTLADIAGKPIGAVSEQAFGGYLTLKYQLLQQHINLDYFFSDVQFIGFPVDTSLYQLRDGIIQASVVPVCLLENMHKEGLLNIDDFRVINKKPNALFHCQVSTELYPNWSLAKTEKGSVSLAKAISTAMLAMPPDSPAAIAASASGWTSPISQLSVDKLYQGLSIHPLQEPLWKETLRWLTLNQLWAWSIFLFIVILNIYHFYLEYRFSKSKAALEQTANRLKEKSEMLEHSQRMTMVQELGSSLAHEINQPLAAIRNYSEGGLIRLTKNKPTAEIIPVFEKIQAQVERADSIINRLRRLIKNRDVEKENCDISAIIQETIELLNYRLQRSNVNLTFSQAGTNTPLVGDPIGLQQVLVNVINNAIDSCLEYQVQPSAEYQALISIQLNYLNDRVQIYVLDNGCGTDLKDPVQAFVSTKKNGLGLGLAICRDVIEFHHGELSINNHPPHGCIILISLPHTTLTKTQ